MSFRLQFFSMLVQLLSFYNLLLLIRILSSWFINPYKMQSNPVGYWLCLLTDPFLQIFRRLPFAHIGGIIDISPIFAFLSIDLLKSFFALLSIPSQLSLWLILKIFFLKILIGISNLISMILFVLSILLLLRLLALWFSKNNNIAFNYIDYHIRRTHQKALSFLGFSRASLQSQLLSLLLLFIALWYMSFQLVKILQNWSL